MIYVLFDVPNVVWVDQSKSVHKISEDLNLEPASKLIVLGTFLTIYVLSIISKLNTNFERNRLLSVVIKFRNMFSYISHFFDTWVPFKWLIGHEHGRNNQWQTISTLGVLWNCTNNIYRKPYRLSIQTYCALRFNLWLGGNAHLYLNVKNVTACYILCDSQVKKAGCRHKIAFDRQIKYMLNMKGEKK